MSKGEARLLIQEAWEFGHDPALNGTSSVIKHIFFTETCLSTNGLSSDGHSVFEDDNQVKLLKNIVS